MTMLQRKWTALAGVLAVGAMTAMSVAGAGALQSGGGEDRTVAPEPTQQGELDAVSDVPGVVAGRQLNAARVDLAMRLGIDTAEVRLVSIEHTAWDGCLGIHVEGQACTAILVPGTIAMYQANGELYRYHIADDEVIATDFVDGEVTDGGELEPGLAPPSNVMLAHHARFDLAVRLGLGNYEDITITSMSSVTFPGLCLGFEWPFYPCPLAQTEVDGAIVMFAFEGEEYRYHVSERGYVAVSFAWGQPVTGPDPEDLQAQDIIREDLAGRLGVPVEEVSILAFNDVRWPDGCLGFYPPDTACTEAIVDGFLAYAYVNGTDTAYRYHGAGETVLGPAYLADGVEIGDPLPPTDG